MSYFIQWKKDIQQNSFTHSKAVPVMSHHDKSLQRYNLRELLTQKFQTLLSKWKQRSRDHDTQSAAVTQLWAGHFSNTGLSGSQRCSRLNSSRCGYTSVMKRSPVKCRRYTKIRVNTSNHSPCFGFFLAKFKKIKNHTYHHCWEVNRLKQVVNINTINISGVSGVRPT